MVQLACARKLLTVALAFVFLFCLSWMCGGSDRGYVPALVRS